ncbi:hypothetical protein GOP47_0004469 [Adiantum capillus-veneris]|uniref:Homeobox domain-containing protein n=1 Tax=Adiantum capillus-veneris TaxID=13818 RepID=A0A9D4V7I3_ADICA|nr:hypothetical protein GOP47_0003759 [Adiantum capillus-veneris]KAI5081286.1 hypothetical protein GOP47_0004469 [Adiantum capillus-veneris]
MFPHRGSGNIPDQPDPNYNPPLTSAAAQSHSQQGPTPSSSTSTGTASAMSTVPSENPSLNVYLQHHHHERPPQQPKLSNLQQWSYLSPYVGAAGESAPTEGASRYSAMASYMQPPPTLSREEAQQLLAAQHPSLSAAAQNAVPLSMMPTHMQEQFYNEQLLRSALMRGRSIQGGGSEPRSMYDSLQQMQSTTGSGSSSVLTRTLESIGRAASSEGATAARYEETCTPRPRWCPTQEQIQILESIFNSGTTTPTRDMIVDIAAQLRKYGTIAEANVFYWFQNRKARAKRKLQPPPTSSLHGAAQSPPISGAAGTAIPDRSSTAHSFTSASHMQNVASQHISHEHAPQSKSRRLSLKHASASSPTSSSSPDHHQYVPASIGGPTSSSPLLQQQSTSINKPIAHQESTLLVANRGVTSSAPALPHTDQPISYNPWPYSHLERQPAQEETSDVHAHAAMPASSVYPHSLLQKHGGLPGETQIATIQKLLEYPRISLSLAPPTDQPSSQGLSHPQPAGLGYNTSYSDHHFLHAVSKGIVVINPQPGALGGDPIIGASNTMSSVVFSQLGPSGGRQVEDLSCAAANELSHLQSHQLPQSSVPVARPADYQAGSARMPLTSAAQSGASALMAGADQEQLQMWEDLDSCGNPWNAAVGQGGQGHHQS